MKTVVDTSDAPAPVGPYSQAILAGEVVYTAGQIGIDPTTGRLVSGDVVAQARQVFANLTAVLAAAGLGLDDVVKTTVFLADLADGPVVNTCYADTFGKPYPARSTVQVAGLPMGARIEVDAIATRRR